jgi:hypothetical protein
MFRSLVDEHGDSGVRGAWREAGPMTTDRSES